MQHTEPVEHLREDPAGDLVVGIGDGHAGLEMRVGNGENGWEGGGKGEWKMEGMG